MQLRDYLRTARQHWWLVLAVTVVALLSAVVVNVRTTPQYAASVTFFITTPNRGVTDAYQGGLFSQQRVKSYADLLTSDRLAAEIVVKEAVGLDAAQVQSRISAEPVPDTVLLEATVVDRYRARALRVAHGLARQFKALVESLETPQGAAASAVKVEVIAGPRLQAEPVAPRPWRNLAIALLLGLIAGLAAAVLRELLDTSVKSGETLQQAVGAPLLGTIPFDSSARQSPLILEDSIGSARAEALRQLRTNLQFVGVDQPIKTIVITSAVPGEGKSSTATNLAIVLAESGRNVLLVDADLRRPRLAEYLGLEGGVGLTNVLVGQAGPHDVIQQWGRSRLSVLPSGFNPPNPSELLGSQHMGDLLAELGAQFDTIIIDAPPLLPVTDAAVLAGRADGALVVSRCAKTGQSQIKMAAAALRAVQARLVGCVLNMVPTKGSEAYHYYDYRPDQRQPSPLFSDLMAMDQQPGRHGRQRDATAEALTGAGSTGGDDIEFVTSRLGRPDAERMNG
jgi:capsular exopolysaccharide synthesis family protein